MREGVGGHWAQLFLPVTPSDAQHWMAVLKKKIRHGSNQKNEAMLLCSLPSHILHVLHLLNRAVVSRTFSLYCVTTKPNIALWEGPKHLTQVKNNQCLGFIAIQSPCHNIIWPLSRTLCSSHILLWLYFLFISFCASSVNSKTLHRVCFDSPHKCLFCVTESASCYRRVPSGQGRK